MSTLATRTGVASVLAEDVAGGNTLKPDNFENAGAVTASGVYQTLEGPFFFVSFRVNGQERIFRVTVTEG